MAWIFFGEEDTFIFTLIPPINHATQNALFLKKIGKIINVFLKTGYIITLPHINIPTPTHSTKYCTSANTTTLYTIIDK